MPCGPSTRPGGSGSRGRSHSIGRHGSPGQALIRLPGFNPAFSRVWLRPGLRPVPPTPNGVEPGHCNRTTRVHPSLMFPVMMAPDSGQWIPGPYPGVDLMVLRRDEATGGLTVLRKFHPGVTVPAHSHPQAAESVWVVSGEWEEDGRVYGAGTFFHVPRGVRHGPHVARSEVVSLTVFDGPLTVA